MPQIGLIVGMDPNGIIGADGGLPWKISADLKRFKATTMDGTIIVGSKTYLSMPAKLPGRNIIVVTREPSTRKDLQDREPAAICKTVREAIEKAKTLPGDIWVGGGSFIYAEALKERLVDVLDVTMVPVVDESNFTVITRFPIWFISDFRMVKEEANPDDPQLTQRRYER